MAPIELTKEETEVLQEILDGYLSDLRLEIGNTEKQGVREELKRKEPFVKRVLGRLTAGDVEDFLSDINHCPAICRPPKQFHRWRH